MDRALIRLLMMRLRGGLRQRLIQLTSLRGLLFFLAFGGIIWLLIIANGPSSGFGGSSGSALDRQAFSAQIRTFMPLGMLGMSLLTVVLSTGPTFHFSPTEINFLFTGPFRRRDLIIYKFGAYVAGVVLSCALITPFAAAQTGSVLIAFVGSFLTLIFVQLNSAVIGMSVQSLDGGTFAWIRRFVAVILFLGAIATLLYAWAAPDRGLFDLLSEFRHSWIGTIILIPYIVFTELFVASSFFPYLALWAVLAVIINLALLRMVIALDAGATDRSLSENAKRSALWERMKQGGSFWASDRIEVRSYRRAPIWGGLGPIAWRQALHAARNSFKVILVFASLAACVGPLTATVGVPATDPRVLTFIYIFFGYILPRTLVCDFRGDLSRMEIYKTLPIAPWRICLGQLLAQVLLTYMIVLIMLVSFAAFEDRIDLQVGLAFAVYALPLTVLIYAVENTIHLLFPTKLVPMGQADFEFLGRSLVEFIAKSVFVLVASSISLAVALITMTTLTTSWALAGFAGWIALSLIVVLMLIVMQFAFGRFAVAETVD